MIKTWITMVFFSKKSTCVDGDVSVCQSIYLCVIIVALFLSLNDTLNPKNSATK